MRDTANAPGALARERHGHAGHGQRRDGERRGRRKDAPVESPMTRSFRRTADRLRHLRIQDMRTVIGSGRIASATQGRE